MVLENIDMSQGHKGQVFTSHLLPQTFYLSTLNSQLSTINSCPEWWTLADFTSRLGGEYRCT